MTSSTSTPRIKECAALLFAWSVFALIEGVIRMTSNSKPSLDVDYWATENAAGNQIMPVGALLIAGVAEVLFGILGCYVAFLSLLLDINSPKLTTLFLFIQVPCGWFVFLTYVIASPIIGATNAQGNDLLSQSEQRSLIILGNMLGSICFCWALQGGQFIMGTRLLAAQKGQADSKAKNKMRAMVWAGNMLAAAFSTLFVGSLLASKNFTSTTAPVGAPPHVVWFPAISIVTGVVMFLYGIMSCMATGSEGMNNMMHMGWLVCTTMMMVNFSWTFGIVPGLAPPIPGAAQHVGLIFSVTILPIFHTHRAHNSIEDNNEAAPLVDDNDKYQTKDIEEQAVPEDVVEVDEPQAQPDSQRSVTA